MGDSDDDDAPIGAHVIKRKIEGAGEHEPDSKKRPTSSSIPLRAPGAASTTTSSASSSSSSSSASAAPSSSSSSGKAAAASNDDELPEWWDDSLSVVVLMERRNKHLKEQAAIHLKKMEEQRKKQEDSKGSGEKREPKVKKETPNVTTSDKGRPQGDNRAADYYDTLKGQIVQTLLVRWWYAYDWPTDEEVEEPPSGFEEMEGFRGIFVSMNLDSLGKVVDLRDKTNCPSLKQMSKRPCKELQELCVKALRKQIADVKEAEGDDCALAAELKKKIKVIERIDAEAAEREINKAGAKFVF